MSQRFKGKSILVGVACLLGTSTSFAQVAERGISPAANTYRSYNDASINRDSGIYQPLDLLSDFYPSIEVRIEDHDNVRRRSDFDEEDLLVWINPSLGYRTNIGRHEFYAAYNGSFTFHQDLEQEDAESNTVSAKLGLDLTRRWDLELFASLGESFEERGISGGRSFGDFLNNGVNSGPETTNFVSYGGDLIFGRKIGILQGVLGYDYNAFGFENDDLDPLVNFADGRDRESHSVHLDLNYQFSDLTSVFGRVQYTDTDYDRFDSDLDSTQVDYLLGLRWRPASSLSGAVGVGVSDRDFDAESREDFDSAIYYANLTYSINPFSTLNFNAARTFEEPGEIGADFYRSDFIALGWTHALTPRTVFDVYAKAIDDDYNNGREDDFFDWGVELSYAWRNWMTASIYYGDIDRDSNRENTAFDSSFIGIRLRSDLRSLLRSSGGSNRDRIEPYSFGKPEKRSSVKPK